MSKGLIFVVFYCLFGMGEVGFGFPGIVFRSITFPVDKVLGQIANLLGIKDRFDFIFFLFIDLYWIGGGRLRLRREWLLVGSEEYFIEDWVNSFPSFGDFELVGRGPNRFKDLKGSMLLVSKLLHWSNWSYISAF